MNKFLTELKFMTEVDRCVYCEDMPCMEACPVSCSPPDFIKAVKLGADSDIKRASEIILSSNILGGICGSVCPDYHCMAACSKLDFDNPIRIPEIQSAIVNRAKELGFTPEFDKIANLEGNIAVIGGGPAGIGCAHLLVQFGFKVDIFEKEKALGGMCRYIPNYRLGKEVLDSDIDNATSDDSMRIYNNMEITDLEKLKKIYDAVVISTGQDQAIKLNIEGKELTYDWKSFLDIEEIPKDSRVAIIGGGAVAIDCAMKAKLDGSNNIDLYMLEQLAEMKLSSEERDDLFAQNFGLLFRTSVKDVTKDESGLKLSCQRVRLTSEVFDVTKTEKIANSDFQSDLYDYVVFAIGSRATMTAPEDSSKMYFCGDQKNGATTVVEAVASGKNCALKIASEIGGYDYDSNTVTVDTKNRTTLVDSLTEEISLECDFFGRTINSPLILSAAPPTDGYDQVKKAYDAGWAGAVMKTAFDDEEIHIPHDYMFRLNEDTYANCDNVSEIPLRKVIEDAKRLQQEFPDRITIVSTGGPVTGNDVEDKKVWQSNTKLIEDGGADGVEYSLSCPQGGDGTEGDIVSQNAKITGKVVDWIMENGNKDIPKLFKLTGAVTSIEPILKAIKEVLDRYPGKKAGVTLANSFPAVAFRKDVKKEWEDGIMVGMSGDAVKYISNLTLAKASNSGVTISGNGGVMDYKATADFLALGCKTVQFCTIAMKDGVGVVQDLEQGLRYLMKDRGIKSIADLIGVALPSPILDFMEIPGEKKVSAVIDDLCQHCGNCTRCPYLAITLDENNIPVTDQDRCIGCSVCVQNCFSGALYMGERTKKGKE